MKTVDNSIILNYKVDKTTGELDFDMYVDILGKERVDAAYEENGINILDDGKYCDNFPIKIESLKKIIADLEKNGCNYVSIDYNCDHPDYTFYGVDLHEPTELEIDEINNKEKKAELKRVQHSLDMLEIKRLELLKKL